MKAKSQVFSEVLTVPAWAPSQPLCVGITKTYDWIKKQVETMGKKVPLIKLLDNNNQLLNEIDY